MAITTIQLDTELLEELRLRKLYDRESYGDVIQDLIEDSKEINEVVKSDLEEARRQIAEGKSYSLDEVKKEIGR